MTAELVLLVVLDRVRVFVSRGTRHNKERTWFQQNRLTRLIIFCPLIAKVDNAAAEQTQSGDDWPETMRPVGMLRYALIGCVFVEDQLVEFLAVCVQPPLDHLLNAMPNPLPFLRYGFKSFVVCPV